MIGQRPFCIYLSIYLVSILYYIVLVYAMHMYSNLNLTVFLLFVLQAKIQNYIAEVRKTYTHAHQRTFVKVLGRQGHCSTWTLSLPVQFSRLELLNLYHELRLDSQLHETVVRKRDDWSKMPLPGIL